MDLHLHTTQPRVVELLSPARDASVGRAAIDCGADAIYIGADRFGARAAAGNSVEDIAALCDYAHRYGARVYATLNTIIYDDELREAERLGRRLWRAGIDALIVQDLGLLRLDLPPVALHASTQCDIRTPAKARFLAGLGFSRLVLPREFTLDEIRAVAHAADAELEAFVHGALCVSYSGDCQASFAAGGRSANRGQCAQICRLPYLLTDGSGRLVDQQPRHYLSLRDLRRDHALPQMLDAGVMSLKIEGRLKDEAYVKNVTAYYRRRLDEIIAANPDRYRRASFGASGLPFTPAPEKSFNRGFTNYFLFQARPAKEKMASLLTPKWQGEPAAKVKALRPNGTLVVKPYAPLSNGDCLGFFDRQGRFAGCRINSIEGDCICPTSRVNPPIGSTLYCNRNRAFERDVAREVRRTITVSMRLWPIRNGIALEVSDERGHQAMVAMRSDAAPFPTALAPQGEAQGRILAKLGGTIYQPGTIDCRATDGLFIHFGLLTALRRKAVAALDVVAAVAYRRERRRPEEMAASWPGPAALTRHDNVANALAEQVYRDHGVAGPIERASETLPTLEPEPVVMTTRYCLRRELGACLLAHGDAKLPGPLTLAADSRPLRLRLDFDCPNCRMHVVKL